MGSNEELSDDQLESQDTGDEQSEYKFIAKRVKQYLEILEKPQLPRKKRRSKRPLRKLSQSTAVWKNHDLESTNEKVGQHVNKTEEEIRQEQNR
ncbi:hypothetical protein JTB14_002108 [Gonioctena quinquepunctata]|nr:hypothetical protein JTB14_002108 [Gonioctena quinquepunctata]